MINVCKFVIFVPKGIFLNFIISAAGIKADINEIAAIRDKPQLFTAIEMRAFVNAAGYFRYLIKNYAHLSSPLTRAANISDKSDSDSSPRLMIRGYGLVAEGRHRCARPMPLTFARTRARARPNPASPLRSGSVSILADSFRRVPRDLIVVFPFFFTDLI
jgi:hypothetical protein